MSTIRFNETKTLRPEQYITGLPKEQGLVRTPARRRGLGQSLRGSAPFGVYQPICKIRHQDAREGFECASRLRYGYRGGVCSHRAEPTIEADAVSADNQKRKELP